MSFSYHLGVPVKYNKPSLRQGISGLNGALVAWMIFFIGAFSSWATYNQFAVGLTYVTLPALILMPLMLLSFKSILRLGNVGVSDFCLLGIYLICYLSQIWTLSEGAWPSQFFWYSICFLVYFAVRFFVTTLARMRLVVVGIIIGTLIGGLLVTEQVSEWGDTLERQTVEGVNSNFTAYVLAGSLYISIIAYKLDFFSKWFRFVLILLSVFVLSKILLLGTRGALVSVGAVWTWLICYRFMPKKIITPLIVMLCVIIILFPFGIFDDILFYLDSASSRDTGDLSGRLPSWNFAIKYITDNPFWGIGIGSFSIVSPLKIGAHNVFLTLTLEVGIVGFLLFMAYLFALFSPVFKKSASLDQKFIFGAFFFFWLPIAASGHWELAPFSWLLLGLTFNFMRFSRGNYA